MTVLRKSFLLCILMAIVGGRGHGDVYSFLKPVVDEDDLENLKFRLKEKKEDGKVTFEKQTIASKDVTLDANTLVEEKKSLLLYAVEVGSPNIAKYLVENGADVHFRGPGYTTPFTLAMKKGYWKFIKFCVRNVKDKELDFEEQALKSLITKGYEIFNEFLNKMDKIKEYDSSWNLKRLIDFGWSKENAIAKIKQEKDEALKPYKNTMDTVVKSIKDALEQNKIKQNDVEEMIGKILLFIQGAEYENYYDTKLNNRSKIVATLFKEFFIDPIMRLSEK